MNYNGERKKGNVKLVLLLISSFVFIGIGFLIIYCSYQYNDAKFDNEELSNIEQDANVDDNSDIIDVGENENNDEIKGPSIDDNLDNEMVEEDELENLYSSELESDLIKDIVEKVEPLKIYDYIDYNEYYSELFGFIYQKDILLADNLDSDVRTHLVGSYLVKDMFRDKSHEILLDEFKKNWMLVFGKESDFNFSDSMFNNIVVEKQNDKIVIYYTGDVLHNYYRIFSKYMRVEKNNDNSEIYLYEVIAIADLDGNPWDKKSTYDFYSDLERKNIAAQNVTIDEIFSSEYLDKLQQYRYTFKLEDDNYYFCSIEKVE